MASTKRRQEEAVSEEKRAKLRNESDHTKPNATSQRVVLNPADCDLDFIIEEDGLKGSALYEQGFAYCWSGARANVGITGGKYFFGCKILAVQPVDMEDTPAGQQHVCRVGISRGDDPLANLGETQHSFGFGGTGKFSNAGTFSDYGEKFGVGDTVACAVDLESRPWSSVGFYKNGIWLGNAKLFDAGPKGLGVVDSNVRERQWESAVFPHVLLKNVVVQLQFSIEEGLVPEEGYKPWASALEDANAVMGPIFSLPHDREVIMMVGLPASGKTTWAEKWIKEHPEKRYVLLGTNLALDQMKVPGLLRKHNYGERFDRLMDRATGIFNTLLSRAANTDRNFIIDQTNVYRSARKRKLRSFANFRKIAVVVFTKPEVLKIRSQKRFKEMGKEVPADAVNQMLANFVLPTSKDMRGSDEYFDVVIFPELSRDDAQKYLDEMKRDLDSKVTDGHRQISYSPPPLNLAYSGPSQVASIPERRSYSEPYWRPNYEMTSHYATPPGSSRPPYGMVPLNMAMTGSAIPHSGGYNPPPISTDTMPHYGGYNLPTISTEMPNCGNYIPPPPTGMLQSRYVLPPGPPPPLSAGTLLHGNYVSPPPTFRQNAMPHAQYTVPPMLSQTGVPLFRRAHIPPRRNYY